MIITQHLAAGLLTSPVAAARHSPRAKISCSTSSTDIISPPPLPRRLRRLVAALHSAPDAKTRSLYLMRLGDKLPLAPLTELGPRTRVPGCVSVVHIHASTAADGSLRLAGAADSKLARGLVALLVRGLRGAPADAARQINVRAVAEAAGLPSLLTPGRLNGMEGMLKVVGTQLEEQQQEEEAAVAEELAEPPADSSSSSSSVIQPAPQNPRLLWTAAEEEVALLLSGGVDSSVALHELLKAGHKVRAFYLRIWLEDEQQHAAKGECPWEEDWAYCEAVCKQAGVPLESVSLQHEYQEHVVGYLVNEAAAGRTPNPDVMCNSRIKFGVFHDRIGRHFAHVASGHYARTSGFERDMNGASAAPPPVQLLRSADAHKDQTYFLSQLTQEQLHKALFPIGGMPKPDVRKAAEALHLPNRQRKDSQGICFLGQLNYDDFLRDHLGTSPGPIYEHESGELIGQHNGLWFHTVGQRRGLGPVLNNANRAKGPWHVVDKDFDGNILYATRHYSGEDKARNEFSAGNINWIAGEPPGSGGSGAKHSKVPLSLEHLRIKVRHGAESHAAVVTLTEGGKKARVQLKERDKGLAPGQFAAFYDGEVCLGSGVITEGAI